MAIASIITMNDGALYRLMAWLSPSYPVGAFSYSHGIEWLVEAGAIEDAASLISWLGDILTLGSGRNDAILFAAAYRAAMEDNIEGLIKIADHASAFCATSERALETNAQGNAFAEVTRKTWSSPVLDRLADMYTQPISYPVAVGAAAADHGITLRPALEAYVHAFAANLVSAGVRLIPLGHTDGQRVLIALEPAVVHAVEEGMAGDLSALASALIIADIAAMKHETQYTRLFRS